MSGTGIYKLRVRADIYKIESRTGKHKLGARNGQYKLEARAGSQSQSGKPTKRSGARKDKKPGTYLINLDGYENMETIWMALHVNDKNVT